MEDIKRLNTRVVHVETDISELKAILKEAFYLSIKNELAIAQLSDEMKAFKDEVRKDYKQMNKE